MKCVTLLLLICLPLFAFPQDNKVVPADFDNLVNVTWRGQLMYLDYSTSKEEVIPVNLIVRRISDREYSFAYSYPDEPQANSVTKIMIAKDGGAIDKETIIQRSVAPDGLITIVSETMGKDNDIKADFRYTYQWNANRFSIKKEVKKKGQDAFFKRNEYSFTKCD